MARLVEDLLVLANGDLDALPAHLHPIAPDNLCLEVYDAFFPLAQQRQHPLSLTLPVPKLMARIGLPIVLSMILQAAYNVVDSAYLARMAAGGETALTALSLAFPVQLFMVAVSIGTGVGTNALLARLLGLGDKDRADAAMGNAQFLALVISLCRQVLFVLPPVWALTRLVTGPENVSLVWWPLALGEAATLVVALVLYQKRAKKRIDF